ncbi:hypothetical protein X801_01257 [Opisthorchis viverrini]|uniref:Uncharacterized protein n=1 Tax=Opisthorchis viverrini TaxID=6198 RepID=A0A1S8X818_OPIVI|nr:hypothetical protein X801_01257 [Opisthorchis viverrini]
MLSRRANKHQGIITLDTANKFERVTQPGCLKRFYNRRNQGDRDNYSWKVRPNRIENPIHLPLRVNACPGSDIVWKTSSGSEGGKSNKAAP